MQLKALLEEAADLNQQDVTRTEQRKEAELADANAAAKAEMERARAKMGDVRKETDKLKEEVRAHMRQRNRSGDAAGHCAVRAWREDRCRRVRECLGSDTTVTDVRMHAGAS